ncbi:hypothetical protein FJZ31_40855 [Candidatus Poribacteria bacterium]|nr:hypothetical protein [Candidatus Poribacteria bacterium]
MSNRNISTTSIIIFIFCALCFQTSAVSAEEESAEKLYESAFKFIVEGDYSEAYDKLDEIIAKCPNTPYAQRAENRKQRLENLDLPSIRRKKIDQSGRVESVVFSTLYSTWLGIGSARLLSSESAEKPEKAVAAGMMIGAPAGLLTSLKLTQNARLTNGQAALINFSGYWGTWQGYGWSILLDKNDDEKTLIGGTIAGGLLGLAATSALTKRIDLSLGDAGIINYGGLWGTWLSLCAGIVADVEDDDELLGLVLTGGNLGAAAMAVISPKTEISLARASLINLSGIVGTIVASGLLLITQPDDAESAFVVLAAGGILGLAAGGLSTQGFDAKSASQKSSHEKLSWSKNPVFSDRYNSIVSVDMSNHLIRMNPHALKISSKWVQANLLSIQF